MIDFLEGEVKKIEEKSITLLVNGIGFKLLVAQPKSFVLNKKKELYTYMHWNSENGPSLFGFQDEFEKQVFLLIIDCPKIGPGIAMNILSQLDAYQFVQVVSAQNQRALSDLNGIGPKKAEQIIVHLKDKASKLMLTSQIHAGQAQQDFTQWQNINDVLVSLNYSRPEISKALQYLTEKYSNQNVSLDLLIRSALSFLSGNL